MKKFKKGVLAIGVLAAMAVIAAGCGKKMQRQQMKQKKKVQQSQLLQKKRN